ncbi:HD domain-containing protein [Halobacillus sp. A5]|uniref:HD domain-containing protein n=1 Tax=Halobacillus sp. A5 TaxID=2880263 RepID=UPI0020A638F2|nr:HD domain-containing protein [Halobacillus sp. A5]MCP3025907.1 HD domain-containing protein [Halobacillus sp. A5]
MREERILELVQQYVNDHFEHEPSGHDYYHMKRVAKWAGTLAFHEGADSFTAELAGWLHDIGDSKLFDDPDSIYKELDQFLSSIQISPSKRAVIFDIIKNISFSKGQVPESIEGKIVQDADRLDAIGAVGIARTFAYGGLKKQLIYDENDHYSSSIQHFYDKLLHLSSGMHTKKAQEEARKRHDFMEQYLRQFLDEWNSVERAGEEK